VAAPKAQTGWLFKFWTNHPGAPSFDAPPLLARRGDRQLINGFLSGGMHADDLDALAFRQRPFQKQRER